MTPVRRHRGASLAVVLAAAVCFATIARVRAEESEGEGDVEIAPADAATPVPTPTEAPTAVVELTDVNFDEVVSAGLPVLVQL